MKTAKKTELFEDAKRYRRIIGMMLYLTNTRPENHICCQPTKSTHAKTKARTLSSCPTHHPLSKE
jgi:hypothetical protein